METDSQIDVVDRVVSLSPSSSSTKSSPETDFIPETETPETDFILRAQTLPPSKYGRKWAQVERDHYVSWDKIVFLT